MCIRDRPDPTQLASKLCLCLLEDQDTASVADKLKPLSGSTKKQVIVELLVLLLDKKQPDRHTVCGLIPELVKHEGLSKSDLSQALQPVSYTHLTLPTIYSVETLGVYVVL
eukprot:TRINITY_DN2753_c0_g1_i1.p1 TRINITY_DN2753_c0_g1~~TRINITY_DN2753_c0_g1_i1.p1  ORF type:complete len:111 (-),score=40.25 TRINITY_DN2753_c0_g1_i1:57-389(-)